MMHWQRIRRERTDLTDYVIHFTKMRLDEPAWEARPCIALEFDVFLEILNDGYIMPTFASRRSKVSGTTCNTVRGPEPAVCLTEQPLSDVLLSRKCSGNRYSGLGIAYHKYALYSEGGRPVIYGDKSMLGRAVRQGEPGFQAGKDIYMGGLPPDLQYLWVQYKPTVGTHAYDYPIDFTWEREWRIKPKLAGLPIYLHGSAGLFPPDLAVGALVVESDSQVAFVRELLQAKAASGCSWARKLTKIVSLQTADRMLKEGDARFARIETWPDDYVPPVCSAPVQPLAVSQSQFV